MTRRWDLCQRIWIAPIRLSIELGAENTQLSETILVDIMYVGNVPVLHILDEGSPFSVAKFLRDVSENTIWTARMER